MVRPSDRETEERAGKGPSGNGIGNFCDLRVNRSKVASVMADGGIQHGEGKAYFLRYFHCF